MWCSQDTIVVDVNDTEVCKDINIVGNYDYYNVTKGVNKPQLAIGMIPVVWNNSTWVTATEADTNWYSYTLVDKKWANAIQVTEATRSTYQAPGTMINLNDVLAMWV
jgi:hypothetical protein